MKCLLTTVEGFRGMSAACIREKLLDLYPEANDSQVRSWVVLANDVLTAESLGKLPSHVLLGMEFSLPTDEMSVDLIIVGRDVDGKKVAFLVESKQWDDDYIQRSKFSTHRSIDVELHPQIQVRRHALSFRDYLNVGASYDICPMVFLRNASDTGKTMLRDHNPRGRDESIAVYTNINCLLTAVARRLADVECEDMHDELMSSYLKPCKSIFDAMTSIVSKEEPFILTREQASVAEQVRQAMCAGRKVIRIVGPAGSGKTAILLNLYVGIMARSQKTCLRPVFISGRQNTALYRSVYPAAQGVFTYPYTLERMVDRTNGSKFVILMDEAQHNDEGVVTQVVERGATVILCYDPFQVVSADNPIAEFKRLESRRDYITLELHESIRYSGSPVAERNIKTYLSGSTQFILPDDQFEFKTFNDFSEFERHIFKTIDTHPESTLAVVSQLKFSKGELGSDKFFCDWGYQSECKWVPYVRERHYREKFNGSIWVGTWWLPGLDVDYVAVIIGDDLNITSAGPSINLSKNKLFKPAVALGAKLGVPNDLIVSRRSGYKTVCDYVQSARNITAFLRQNGNEELFSRYIKEMTEIIRNNYYIMMTRGCKGCFVFCKDGPA